MTSAAGTDPRTSPAVRIVQVLGIGLASGLGFVLPLLAHLLSPPGDGRTIALLLTVAAAVLLIRFLGRQLHRLLDATERPRRFPLLALYGVAAMIPLVSMLLLPLPVQR